MTTGRGVVEEDRLDGEERHTDFYDLRRIFNGDWVTTVLAWLRDGARRPRDLEAIADGWHFYDRWRQARRELTRYQIRDALATLTDIGLVEKQRGKTDRFEHQVVYQLTAAGEAYLVELDRQRKWLKGHSGVLDNAVRVYRERHAS